MDQKSIDEAPARSRVQSFLQFADDPSSALDVGFHLLHNIPPGLQKWSQPWKYVVDL